VGEWAVGVGEETMAGKMVREREVAGDPLALKLADNEKGKQRNSGDKEKRDKGKREQGKRKEKGSSGSGASRVKGKGEGK
jgi:hypothetical protein